MKSIQVKNVILLDDGEKYYYSEKPGITVPEFSHARGTSEKEEMENFKTYAHSQFTFSYNESTSFDDLVKRLFKEIGFKYDLAFDYGMLPLNVLAQEKLILIENLSYNFETFIHKYKIENVLELYLIYCNQAGSIWRDDGIEYYMNSKESGSHYRAHVHVDYKHECEASIALDNGEVLAGKIPSKALRIVRKRIEENKEFLAKCWNEMTDGLKIDLNHYFGKKKIENTDKIIW